MTTTLDGSGAVVWMETQISSGAAAYPITPSTNMGVGFQQSVADGMRNVWGEPLVFFEPESEHSAASVCEGFALAGGRVTNFTAGQGLILMKEVLYTIAGKRLPVVFHVGARALTVHALNVHAGHDDVMGVADCGWGMLFARNAQEAADFSLIARRTAEDSFTPYLNIQDGFFTTHTLQTLALPEVDLIRAYLASPKTLHNFLDPLNPVMSGTVQNQDAYMKGKIAQRAFYDRIQGNLERNMAEYARLTGRRYGLVDAYRMEDAEYAIVGMGSFMETAKATVDWIRKKQGVKVGVVSVLSYRPFPSTELVRLLKNTKVVSVLERLDEASAPSNPLARDLKAAFFDALADGATTPKTGRMPLVQQGAGGLGGRDVRVGDFLAIVENMKAGANGKMRYCVGIRHADSLAWDGPEPDVAEADSFSVCGYSIGGYGSVTTNKIIASICADLFDLQVQAFPKYGAEKKGLPTTYYCTIGRNPIRCQQELRTVDLVVINDANAFRQCDPLEGLKPGGTLILQGKRAAHETVWKGLPASAKKAILERNLRLFNLDAAAIAREVASLPSMQQRMQGIVQLGAFLKVTPFAVAKKMSSERLMSGVERVIHKYFGRRGENVVRDNLICVKRGFEELVEVPRGIMK